jgi:hypothetical protein
MIVYGLAIGVGAIHELPLPRLLDIKIIIITKLSNRSIQSKGYDYSVDRIDLDILFTFIQITTWMSNSQISQIEI